MRGGGRIAVLLAAVACLLAAAGCADDGDAARAPATAATAEQGVEVIVFLAGEATEAERDGIRSALERMEADGRVVSFSYRSAEEALEMLRERLEDSSILDGLPENPLPASFSAIAREPADDVAAELGRLAGVDPELGVRTGIGPVPDVTTPLPPPAPGP